MIDYPCAEFFAHQEAWNTRFHKIEEVELLGQKVPVGTDQSTEANAIRVLGMMFMMGVRDEALARKKARAFTVIQMYLRTYVDAFYRARVVTLHDGGQAVVTPQAMAAIHERFLDDPIADPLLVPIEEVIQRAHVIAAELGGDQA